MDNKDKNDKKEIERKAFDIRINEFGEIESNYDVDEINQFLNENLEDKKFSDLDQHAEKQDGDQQE